ncbi:acyltransferase family protein [Hymenobacter nivis]|uniref:Acyltransferase n=1 Tax=Hymenobacter nivis TaxID=1850093 RepID=A0A502GNA9_9BACT|nr:acyltransferase [Hymenobacter nivis]TPG62918.1 acyltransferase [Hymenobacter nivis]
MEPEPRKLPLRFYEIDLLRFLAALSVVLYHYTYRGYMADHYSPVPFAGIGRVTKYGYLGVELFFIISGYVVLLSAQGKTVRQFFLSRVTRLYPAFWAACTLTFLVERLWGPGAAGGPVGAGLHPTTGQYLANLTMLHGFFGVPDLDTAYWTLTIEIAFYFLVSLLIGYHLLRHLDLVLLLWLLYVDLAGAAPVASPFAYLFFPQYAPYFIAGMLFYLLQQPQGRTWLRYVLLAVAFLLALRSSVARAGDVAAYFHDPTAWQVGVGAVTAFFLLFYLVAFRKISFGRFPWLARLGALTYPLYLIHGNIGFVAFHRLGPFLNKYALLGGALVGALLAAYAIHTLVEKRLSKPLGAHINRWLTRLDQGADAAVGPPAGHG